MMREMLAQALRELRADRFRTRLSLLGVAVGIFSIVAALTLVDAVRQSIQEGFSAYGGDILFVDRVPLEPDLDDDGHFRWWEYALRPEPSWREYRFLEGQGAGRAFAEAAFVRYGQERTGVAGKWRLLVQQPLAEGRGFTARELSDGTPVVIVGSGVERPDKRRPRPGEALWIDGVRYEVIGVFAKAGVNTVSTINIDQARLVPAQTLREEEVLRSSILLGGADGEAVRTLLRNYRRLGPHQGDNFALNRLSYLLDEMTGIFSILSKLGWIVGFFSLLVGGFGIANMMYVSVEERRQQIGICRALGARRSDIRREFLGEAAILSLIGGTAGIAAVQLIALLLKVFGPASSAIPLALSLRAALSGLGAALGIGLLSGVAPARAAAALPPAAAITGKR